MATKGRSHLLTSEQVREALRQWHSQAETESPLAMLYQFRRLCRNAGYNVRQATNQILKSAFDRMQLNYPGDVQLLQLRFLDNLQSNQLANRLNVAESTFYTIQKQALDRLTATIQEMETLAWLAQKLELQQRLEAPTYLNLVGIEAHIEHLRTLLCAPEAPWVIALQGLGGLGKTALADMVVRQIIEEGVYDEIGWVSAQQNRLNLGGAIKAIEQPALTTAALVEALTRQLLPETISAAAQSGGELRIKLRNRLKQTPHLIVIDNLETVVDIEALLPTLHELAAPSKFLLTSRQGLYNAPNTYHFQVLELSEPYALQLIRQEAKVSNLPALIAAPDQALQPIYATVGGNPLALRLVVGQTHIYSLASILAHLHTARGQTAENLYTYIYWHAWQSLDETSRDVLLIMPLVNPSGEDEATIAEVGELDPQVVRDALRQLVMLNLIDTRGGLNDCHYSIHGLTRTFLHEQVLRWSQ